MFQRTKEYLTDPSDFATSFDMALGAAGLAIAWASEVPARREDHKKAFKIFCVGATCLAPVVYRALTLESDRGMS